MTAARPFALGALLLLLVGAIEAGAGTRTVAREPARSPVGEAIYLKGVLSSGQPLVATRSDAAPTTGEQAACGNCHRRSGLGVKEARSVIPPIAARFLFHSPAGRLEEEELPFVPGARTDREAYTEATLARAIREGVDAEGRTLSYLMPRFALNDTDMAALIAHLRSLDHQRVPGVSSTELQFATIVTPDADPVKRGAMLDVLQHFFHDRNGAPRGQSAQTMATSGTTAYAKMMFKVNRHWVLHVWELTGPESTWTEQLYKKFAAEPVFAVISGIGGTNWRPVSEFCEERAVPCLLPNLDLPPADADRNFHTLYYSRGVLLEADLIASGLREVAGLKHVHQVYRAGDVGEAAAQALAVQLQSRGVAVSSHVIAKGSASGAVAAALHAPSGTEALVMWLRPGDLTALGGTPVPAYPVYLSGLMGGLERTPLPADWSTRAHMAYPVDLEPRRRVRVDYALGWFRIRQIPVVAEQVQADTYLTCSLVSETVKHLVDAFIPDYLVESLQDAVEHRIISGYYPRLALGPQQRFASKGGYLVHFNATGRQRLAPDGDWITP